MRRIGTLDDGSHAQRFCDFLLTVGIEASTDCDDDQPTPAWNIWVRDEVNVQSARQHLSAFRADPDLPKYQVEAEVTRLRNERVADQQKRLAQRRKLVRSMPAGRSGGGFGPLLGGNVRQQAIPITIGIIVLSVVASFGTKFGRFRSGEYGSQEKLYDELSIADRLEFVRSGEDPYVSVAQGQVWRFFTPMFMHGDMMHLAFNMLWIFFLGSSIERLQGSLFFAVLVLGTHFVAISAHVWMSTLDFLPEPLSGSPFAIGASGAVYGLFGYLWVRPAVDPNYPIRLMPSNIVLMLGWLVLCMTPAIDNVANGAHLGGLFAGIVAAIITGQLAGNG